MLRGSGIIEGEVGEQVVLRLAFIMMYFSLFVICGENAVCWSGIAGVSVDGGEYVSILVVIGGFEDG
nr:hypothetical protein [Phascolarctobacterium succinatutens]